MQAALKKYGVEVYNKVYRDLQTEFGSVAFPSWMTKFNGEDGNPGSHLSNLDLQLWYITECFCYADYPASHFEATNSYLSGFDTAQIAHIKQFAQIFRYNADTGG